MRERMAYTAMVHFLKDRYRRLPSEALGQLLGEMSLDLWNDGEPADSAIAAEWERAFELAEQEERPGSMVSATAIRRAS